MTFYLSIMNSESQHRKYSGYGMNLCDPSSVGPQRTLGSLLFFPRCPVFTKHCIGEVASNKKWTQGVGCGETK